jgi:hypothetical protein
MCLAQVLFYPIGKTPAPRSSAGESLGRVGSVLVGSEVTITPAGTLGHFASHLLSDSCSVGFPLGWLLSLTGVLSTMVGFSPVGFGVMTGVHPSRLKDHGWAQAP